MKQVNRTFILIGIIFVSFVLLPSPSFSDANKSNETSIEKVKKEVAEAINVIHEYSIEQKDDALSSVKTTLDDIDGKISKYEDRIEKKWDKMDQAAREKAKETLRLLRKNRNEVAEWYGGMKHSSDKAWEHVKKGFLKSYDTLSKSYKKAIKEL